MGTHQETELNVSCEKAKALWCTVEHQRKTLNRERRESALVLEDVSSSRVKLYLKECQIEAELGESHRG